MELVAICNVCLGCCIYEVVETENFFAQHFRIAVHVQDD